MNKITFLGSPISTQSLYGLTCRNGYASRYMTKKGKARKESYQWEAKTQYKKEIIYRKICVEVKLYFGDKRKRDIDNFNKILYDSCTGIVWNDDSQVVESHTYILHDKKNPRIELFVYQLI